MMLAYGAAGIGGSILVARTFLRGALQKGHKIPLPTGNGIQCDNHKNSQGLKLQTYHYPQSQGKGPPAAVAVFIHGIGSHTHWEYTSFPGQVYKGSWIEAYNKAGIAVHAMDLQGHGRSEAYQGRMNHVRRFDDFVDDSIEFVEMVKARYEGQKVCVVGVSMGGCVAARLGQRMKRSVDGLVLVAPMLTVEQVKRKPLNRILLPFVDVLSVLTPLMPVAAKAKNTKYPEMKVEVDQDPLIYHGAVRCHMAKECLNIVDDTLPRAAELTAPILIIHSRCDTMTDPQGSQDFFDQLTQTDKELQLLDDMWHSLSKEPGQEKLARTSIEWLLKRS